MPDVNAPPPVQPHLLNLPGYEPVKPIVQLAREAGIDPDDVLKLDANENPFGTCDAVRRAIASGEGWSVYPDPLQADLRDHLGEYVGIPSDRIVAGAGSDELIELTVRALAGPGQRILSCPPTFGMYRFLAAAAAVLVDEVERRADFSVDIDAVLARADDRPALVILASPNNPCGTPLTEPDLCRLLDAGLTVAVDEAYVEYGGSSFAPLVVEYGRLIIFRTFSKWAGLAGLRAGFGVFPPALAEVLLRIKQPYNVNRAAELAVHAALDARGELRAQAAAVVGEREAMLRDFAALSWLRPSPSAANFLLCEVRWASGKALQAALARRGVFVRHFDTPRLRNSVRISVPRPDQHGMLMSRLRGAGRELGLF